MFGSQILEVVIGLVLVYLALSIGCSGVKEVIAAIFSLRAKTLESAVRNMLKNGTTDYANELFKHHLIADTAPTGEKPSYISSRMFAAALFDIVAPADANQPRTTASLRASVARMPDIKLRATLLNAIDSAGGDLQSARERVEHWFDDTMARVSGWYKRTAQKIIFVAGLALCCAVNGDTLMILKELWGDAALRSAAVAGAASRVQAASTGDSTAKEAALTQAIQEIRRFNTPPIGWSREPGDVRELPDTIGAGVLKVLGLLLTAFAIVMGAPFWFDMLNNLINLRSSGNPPETR